jgi:Cof subfamily protein (haloacid dehalogenase superfamily)
MNELYRLIAADIDDTLLDPAGRLTPRTEAAFRRAIAAGVYVVLASGRMYESTRPYAERLGVNAPVVSYNGGMVYDMSAKKALATSAIPMETARAIVRMAEESGIYVQMYTDKGFYTMEHTKYTVMYEASIGVACNITHRRLSEYMTGAPIKLLFIGESKDSPAIIEKFSAEFPEVTFMMSKPHYVEVVAKNVDKSYAVKQVLDILGVKPEEMIAFGDGQNDLSMLNLAGRGYCMLSASQGVRDRCRYFAPSNAEDGCAQVIESLLDSGELGGA